MSNITTATGAVKKVIDNYPIGHEFHGYDLKKDTVKLYPDARGMYVDTLMRIMRKHCHYKYALVDRRKSLYMRTKDRANDNQH